MPPFTNPINKGMEEQEQNGVIAVSYTHLTLPTIA